jgi:hypothetical protein
MDNLAMARQGSSYTEEGLDLAWGLGPGAVREVVFFPPEKRFGRLVARIAAGYILETDESVTPVGYIPSVHPATPSELTIRLSAPAGDGDGLVFNADTGFFDPSPRAANISSISLPDNATAADIAVAFNDLKVVLIEADLMEPDPT